MTLFKSLQRKIISSVLLVTLLLAIIASAISFIIEFQHSTSKTQEMIMQLLDTVENSAAIAAYAKDKLIAQDIVTGLLKNDIVNQVQIASLDNFELIQTKDINNQEKQMTRTLYSPFGDTRIIGHLSIQPSKQYSVKNAIHSAVFNAVTLTLFIAVTGLVILWIVQINFSLPVTFVSNTLHAIKNNQAQRIPALLKNNNDELGRLVEDINNLLIVLESKLDNERFLREKIQQVERELRLIFDSSSAGLFLLDQQGILLTSNITLKQLLNINVSDNTLTQNYLIEDFFNEKQKFNQLLTKALYSGRLEHHDFSLTHDNKTIWLHCLVSKVVYADEKIGIEGVLFNITERVEQELSIKYEANHDSLTGLLRRQTAQTKFLSYIENKSASASLFLMDLDGFKTINDIYGHLAGDNVLIHVAQRLKQSVRSNDIVARLGGDEFLIILMDEESIKNQEVIAERIVKTIQMPIVLDTQTTVKVGISLGICPLSESINRFEDLVRCADEAMYEVKRQGKNGYCCYQNKIVKRFV